MWCIIIILLLTYCKETSRAKVNRVPAKRTQSRGWEAAVLSTYTHRHLCIYNHSSSFSQTQDLTRSPGWPGTQHVDQYVLKLKYFSASAF